MPFYQRGNARIHYEEAGAGFPLFIIYGGVTEASASTVYSDTWAFDGCDWMQLFPAVNPGPRYDTYLAQSPHPGRVVMFGGGVAPYIVDGTTWGPRRWSPRRMHSARGA